MTEFEMAYLANDMGGTLTTALTTSFTITSAFLVAGYYAAHRLSGLMIAIILPIYTWINLSFSFFVYRLTVNLNGLYGKMHDYAASGQGLEWHSVANLPPQWFRDAVPTFSVLISLIVFAATIVFFFQCRRVNRAAETGMPSKSDASPSSPVADGVTIA